MACAAPTTGFVPIDATASVPLVDGYTKTLSKPFFAFLCFLLHPYPQILLQSSCSSVAYSGLLHQLAQMVLAEMVSLCWAKSNVLRLIQAMKFVELVGGNLLAITNLAICVNLALIVSVRLHIPCYLL